MTPPTPVTVAASWCYIQERPVERLLLDGAEIDAAELVWAVVAPCGCLQQALIAANDIRVLRTSEEARIYRHDGIGPLIGRDRQLGWTYQLMRSAAYDLHTRTASAVCSHSPYLGIPIVGEPVGYTWATSDELFGRRTHRRHLILDQLIGQPRTAASPSLCGLPATTGQTWATGDAMLETVPCRRCEDTALAMEANRPRRRPSTVPAAA